MEDNNLDQPPATREVSLAKQPDETAQKEIKKKPPKIEEKPFEAFINQDFIPGLTISLSKYGITDPLIKLIHAERPVTGGDCWMVYGELPEDRKFWLCFATNKITSQKTIAISESSCEPGLLESFLIDERKITLSLLLSRTLQRLNGQKWLGRN